MILTCVICGKPFTSYHSNAKYCSDECKKEGYRQWTKKQRELRDAENARKMLTCPICGKQFPMPRGRRKYCSPECKVAGEKISDKKYRANKRAEHDLNKMVYKAVTTGEQQDESKVQEVLDNIALDDATRHDFKMLDRAVSKSVKVRRKQNMMLLAQDIVEADRLGLSYGQYQAMRERMK